MLLKLTTTDAMSAVCNALLTIFLQVISARGGRREKASWRLYHARARRVGKGFQFAFCGGWSRASALH
jgi:hypothetical protein